MAMEIGHDDPRHLHRHHRRHDQQFATGSRSQAGGKVMGTYDRRDREPGYKGNKPYMLDYRDQNGVRQYEGFRTKGERVQKLP
jgi:hypothetical protein